MRRLSDRILSPLLIALVTFVTYGVLLPQLGFYRDDWYLFVTAQSDGSSGIIRLFQIDRPLIGYFYAVVYPVLDFSPLAWHGATLLLRFLGNLAFWWLLRLLWPAKRPETLAIALLFAVYPGYTVQPNAGVYSTDLIAHAASLASIALAMTATREPALGKRLFLSAMAGALELFYLGMFESAIGLEAARIVLVGYLLWQRDGVRFLTALWRSLKANLLYIALALAFLFWRIFLFQSTRRATNLDVLVGRYSGLPIRSLVQVGTETLKDLFETTVLAWSVPFYQFVSTAKYRDLAGALGAALVVVMLSLLVLRAVGRNNEGPDGATRTEIYSQMIGIGALVALFALLPIDLAGRNVLFTDQWDRYTLYASSGVALIVGGALLGFLSNSSRAVVLAALIGMSVAVHFLSAVWYRDFWMWQRDFWQQMTWRAPALQAGTMLFVELPVGGYQEGYEIYGPANIIYFPGQRPQLGGDVINASTVANLQLQKNRQHYDRTELIEDNYRNALVAVYPAPSSCLHVLDGRKIELPGLINDSLAADAAAYSRIEMITAAAKPADVPAFLGGHAPRSWCKYYQSMDLARQRGDWPEVASLADEALAADITPDDVSEWMPALEAYATLGRVQDMRRTAAIIRSVDATRAFLCLQLQRGSAYPEPYDYNLVNQTLCQAN